MAPTEKVVGKNKPYWDLGEKEEEEASSFALSLLGDSIKFTILKAVIDLGVLEIIKKCGPGSRLSPADIASKLPTSNVEAAAATLGRLLDFLVSHSVLTVTPITLANGIVERHYGLTPVCKFFTLDEDGLSLAHYTNDAILEVLIESTLHIKDAILEGEEPFKKAFGMSFYEYSGKNPEFQKAFHKAMSDQSTLVLRKILRTYKGFEGVSTLVDVGGGNGATLHMIHSQYPSIKGINFDEPHVIADAPSYPGIEHVAGDMFANIPKGDAIFLKSICHCFNDDTCVRILQNCYASLPEKYGKVIICEYNLPSAHETTNTIASSAVVQADMIMVALPGGKERTKEEFESLAFSAGFQGFQVVCSAYNYKLMELLKNNN